MMVKRLLLVGLLLVLGFGSAWALSPTEFAPVNSGGNPAMPALTLCLNPNGDGDYVPCPAQATGAYTAASVGTTAASLVAASAAKQFIDITNASATATVCLSVGGTPTISGTQCAGTGAIIPLSPGWHKSWPEGGFLPTDTISAIASAAATPVSVGVK